MRNKSKKLLLALLLTCSVAMLASGCDKLKKEPETEAQTEPPTEAPTEAPTEPQTEPPTEPQTEPPTETELQTESETEPKVLTIDEEKAQETEYDQLKLMYAMDDINVRTKPGTDDSAEIFESFMQGDAVTVVGETPNWYMVELDDYESYGYVSKQFMSETAVEPKTEEERLQIIEQQANEAGSGGDTGSGDSGSSGTDTSAVDAEYGVGAYAESFTVQASTGANLRTTPSQDGEIIATIASGTNVTALGETDRWYKVSYDGTVGYVNKNLFTAQ